MRNIYRLHFFTAALISCCALPAFSDKYSEANCPETSQFAGEYYCVKTSSPSHDRWCLKTDDRCVELPEEKCDKETKIYGDQSDYTQDSNGDGKSDVLDKQECTYTENAACVDDSRDGTEYKATCVRDYVKSDDDVYCPCSEQVDDFEHSISVPQDEAKAYIDSDSRISYIADDETYKTSIDFRPRSTEGVVSCIYAIYQGQYESGDGYYGLYYYLADTSVQCSTDSYKTVKGFYIESPQGEDYNTEGRAHYKVETLNHCYKGQIRYIILDENGNKKNKSNCGSNDNCSFYAYALIMQHDEETPVVCSSDAEHIPDD